MAGALARTRMLTRFRESSFVLKYYAYMATLSAGFVYPITTQYKLWRGLSYADVGLVGAVFMGTWVLAEIPTGYLGDRFGRRRVLVWSSAANAVVMFGLGAASTVTTFAVATFGWAVAYSLRSGAGSAWLYDLLRERLGEGQYARVRGRGLGVMLGVTAIASLVGGVLAGVGWTYPYLLNGVWFAAGVLVLRTLPDEETDGDVEVLSPREAAAAVRRVVVQPPLRSFVRYFAAFFAFFELVDLYIQPVATAIGFSRPDLGVLYAAFYVVAAVISLHAGWIRERIGVRAWFLGAPFVVAGSFVAIGLFPPLAVPAFFVVKVANRASSPLMQQYVNDHLEGRGRATGVSAVTMVGGFAAVVTRTVGGYVADLVGPTRMLALFALGLAVVLAALALSSSPVRPGYRADAADD